MIEVFIAPTGDDETGAGTDANPWRSLQKAHNDANGVSSPVVGGDIITCKDGTYNSTVDTNERLVIWTASGSSGNPITVRAGTKHGAIFVNDNTAAFCITNWGGGNPINYVTFDGLKFDTWGSAFNIKPDNSTVDIIIKNCFFIRNRGTAAVSIGVENDGSGNSTNTIIEGCTFEDIGRSYSHPVQTNSFDHAIYYNRNAVGAIIRNNYFSNCHHGACIQGFIGSSGWRVYNNVFWLEEGNTRMAIIPFGSGAAANQQIYNNVIYVDTDGSGLSLAEHAAEPYNRQTGHWGVNFKNNGSVVDHAIKNNIFWWAQGDGQSAGTDKGVILVNPNKTAGYIDIDYNLYDETSGRDDDDDGNPEHGNGLNSFTTSLANIAFTDAANGDLSILGNSSAINQGIDLSGIFATDFIGTVRPQGVTFDIGAYEVIGLVSTSGIIIDNGDSGTAFTGTWTVSSGANPYGANSLYANATATYTYTATSVYGNYHISMWWTWWANRQSSISVEIYDDTTLLDTVIIDQTILNDAGKWNLLGTYTFTGTAKVKILAVTGGTTCADAVKIYKGSAFKYYTSFANYMRCLLIR